MNFIFVTPDFSRGYIYKETIKENHMKKFVLILCIISLTINGIWAKSKKKKNKDADAQTEVVIWPGYDEPVMPSGDIFEIDNFEDSNYWKRDTQNSNRANNVSTTTKWASSGKSSLKCDYSLTKNAKDRAYFVCEDLVENDWTGAEYVVFNVYNPGKECLYFTFGTEYSEKIKNEDNEVVFENSIANLSEEYMCPPGEHLVVVNVKDFDDLYNTSGILVIVSTETTTNTKTASFYIDNIRVVFNPQILPQTSD